METKMWFLLIFYVISKSICIFFDYSLFIFEIRIYGNIFYRKSKGKLIGEKKVTSPSFLGLYTEVFTGFLNWNN